MATDEEEQQIRAAALKNIEAILSARQRAETALLTAKLSLEKRTDELQQQRKWFEVTLASIGDAVITTDTEGRVTFMNPIAETLTGWPLADAERQPLRAVFRIINEDTRQPVENPIEKVLETGQVVGLANHTALISRAGMEVSIEDSAAPIRDPDGKVAGAVMVFHDVSRRRAAERALRSSEERLSAVFSQAALGIAVADLDGRFQEANFKFCSILGYSLEELRQHTFLDLTYADDLVATLAKVKELREGKIENYALEKRYVRKDGSLVWSSTTVTLLRKGTGEAAQFIGIIQDITERKEAVDTMSRLAAVVEYSDDAIITKTLEGIISTWNPGATRIFGYTADEAIGKPVTLLIPPEHLDEEPGILERLRRGERIDHYETVRRRKDGTLINVSLTVSPIKDEHGRIYGASKIARDITRQKRAEELIREQAHVLALLDTTGKSIASQLDLQNVLQTVTDTATQLTGAKFGAFFYNIINEQGEAFLLYTLSGARREDFEKFGLPRNTAVFHPTFTGQGVVRSADITKDPRYGKSAPHHGMPKGHLPVRSYLAVPVVSRSGEVMGGLFFGHPDVDRFTERAEQVVIGVAAQAAVAMDNARLYEAAQREIASRERAEAALRETDQRKDEFLATLAHELRNPLAPIRQATLISMSADATPDQKRWAHEVITRQVRHMSVLLDDLLDISRITRGTLELRTEMTDIKAVVDAAVETSRPTIDAKMHDFHIELPREPVKFAADPLRLAQVLSNLLTNAAKYTDPRGRIRLRATADADTITISVTDTGIGLSQEGLTAVFRMFSQVQSTRDRSDGGLGIGLALSKGLVQLHGGTIEASSAGHGQGSEFVVRIPRRTIASAAPQITEGTILNAHKRRVLIADDNRDAAESLAMLLEMHGHTITVVSDGRQALAAIESSPPEVALLDIGMPHIDGYEVARRVRGDTRTREVLLIAVTGWGQEQDKARAMAAGFDLHFTKPIEPQQLIELLAAELPGR
ncbi:MAG TPA: PAS domain S-box protein [Steroidobacteraceae bacterium]|nr:PAS domain S-box protein [Steroidobacteraceae bacterium]